MTTLPDYVVTLVLDHARRLNPDARLTSLVSDGEFRYIFERSEGNSQGYLQKIDFPNLGFAITLVTKGNIGRWQWSREKPSEETIALLCLAFR